MAPDTSARLLHADVRLLTSSMRSSVTEVLDSEPAVLEDDLTAPAASLKKPAACDRASVEDPEWCETRHSLLSGLLLDIYGLAGARVRTLLRKTAMRLEGGDVYSVTLRRIFAKHHGVTVGMYTHGGCFVPGHMPPGTRIGRYGSIAVSAMAFGRNHPMNLRSSHAFFFNPRLGIVDREIIPFGTLTIGHDVWLGHNAIIMPSVRSIADGAVIGAGAVVHKDVPPYAVVAGNPGRVVHYRFSAAVVADLIASRWWQRPISELQPFLAEFQRPLERGEIR